MRTFISPLTEFFFFTAQFLVGLSFAVTFVGVRGFALTHLAFVHVGDFVFGESVSAVVCRNVVFTYTKALFRVVIAVGSCVQRIASFLMKHAAVFQETACKLGHFECFYKLFYLVASAVPHIWFQGSQESAFRVVPDR